MSRRRANLLASLSLLLLSLAGATTARKNFREIFVAERIADKLRLLEADAVLESFSTGEDVKNALSPDCAKDLEVYERAVRRGESWALKILDASSKSPTGVLHGHIMDLGMFDECSESKDEASGIRGRHCMYKINPSSSQNNFYVKPTMSICLPSSCGPEDVIGLMNGTINASEKLKDFRVTLSSASCTSAGPRIPNRKFINSAILIAIFVGFILLCTLIDIMLQQSDVVLQASSTFETLSSFSILKSTEKVFSSKSRDDSLSVIHGIRALSMTWVLCLHEYTPFAFQANVNSLFISEWVLSWRSVFAFAALYAVDTFFTLSGFLVAYTYFKKIEKGDQFNIFLYYLHRYMRLTPPMAIFTIIAVALMPVFSTGPLYDMLLNIYITGCPSKFWTILLYVHNFVQYNNFCLLHLWSLAVDMQLFWISPLILYPLYKKPQIGFGILTTLILISVILSGWIVGVNKYSALFISFDINVPLILGSLKDIYVMPYTRASPWLFGILFGYLVTRQDLKPNKKILSTGWILATGSFLFCIYGIKSINSVYYEYNITWEIIVAALSRPFWGFAICWIIYASYYGFGGPISKVLSSKMFLPVSKISYSVYLIHVTLPNLQTGITRTTNEINSYLIFHSCISNLCTSLLLGFCFHVLFEAPFLRLDEITFKEGSKSKFVVQKMKET